MRTKNRGQVLILLAVLTGILVIAVLAFLNLSTLYAVRSHARTALQTAASAGVRCMDYEEARGRPYLDPEETTALIREVFLRALSLQTYGLGASPEEIAQGLSVEVHNDLPWIGPSGLTHTTPGVAVQVQVPVHVLFFTVDIPIRVETEAKP